MVDPAPTPRMFILIAAGICVTSCATGDGMQEKLRDASSGYNRSVRWSDFDRAAGFLPGTSQPGFLTHHDEIGDKLVIVDYELTRLDLDKSTGIAASRAEIVWHTDRRLILETTTVDQLWQWHEGRFLLVDERRSSGTPLAAFAEADQPHPYLPGLEEYRRDNAIDSDDKKKRLSRRQTRRKPARTAPTGAASAAAMALDAPAPASPPPRGSDATAAP
ncbi:MAG: hypothetical protein K0V04_42035 [Deltaproteobacteria bacterium]|nr:hypothetical protein [Deltaproteobacteria bacterium]